MPLDPAAPFPLDPIAAQYDKTADLSRRVGWLERGSRGAAVGRWGRWRRLVPGLPSHDTVDGALYVNLTNGGCTRGRMALGAGWR